MQKQGSNSSFWQAKWRRVTAGIFLGAVVFIAVVLVLWMASYFLRFFLPFDRLFQSPVILEVPEVLIPLVFYDVLALPPVIILAVLLSWSFGRYLRKEKGLHFVLCLLVGLLTVPVSFFLVSIVGMVLSGGAADASAFAFLAPLPPAFILGYLPGWRLGKLLYNHLTMQPVSS
jgi:hypothetical protein